MSTAQDRGWGNPDDPNFRTNHIVKLEVAGITLYVHRAISYLAKKFVEELVALGINVAAKKDDWAYANRNIFVNGRDTGQKSNHSWGLALDIDATANPVSYDGVVHTEFPKKKITAIAAKYGFFWGGNYSRTGYRDPMHFEFLDTPKDAVALTASVRAANRKSTPTPVVPSTPVPENVVPTPAPKKPVYKFAYVRPHDTWRTLSRRYYGTPKHWKRLRRLNGFIKLQCFTKIRVPV